MYEIFKISLIAFIFTELIKPKMILSFYGMWIMKLPEWISFPLGLCYMCFVGQACLWYYLITYFKGYDIIEHLFFVSLGIIFSVVYKILFNYADR